MSFELFSVIRTHDIINPCGKILPRNLKTRGFQYVPNSNNTNTDHFNIEKRSCAGGGLYFSYVSNIYMYFDIGEVFCYVKFLNNDEPVFVDNCKFKTHNLFIENVIDICDMNEWQDTIFCVNAVKFSPKNVRFLKIEKVMEVYHLILDEITISLRNNFLDLVCQKEHTEYVNFFLREISEKLILLPINYKFAFELCIRNSMIPYNFLLQIAHRDPKYIYEEFLKNTELMVYVQNKLSHCDFIQFIMAIIEHSIMNNHTKMFVYFLDTALETLTTADVKYYISNTINKCDCDNINFLSNQKDKLVSVIVVKNKIDIIKTGKTFLFELYKSYGININFNPFDVEVMCRCGHLEMLKFVLKCEGKLAYDQYAMNAICENNHLHILQYFKEIDLNILYTDHAIKFATTKHNLTIIDFLKENGTLMQTPTTHDLRLMTHDL